MKCHGRHFLLTKENFLSQELMCVEIVDSMVELIREELSSSGLFHLALTGGEAGGVVSIKLAQKINEDPAAYLGLHVWWSDERFVSQENPERNSRAFLDSLDNEGFLHIHESTAADFNIDVETSARRYAADMFDVDINLTLLSIGSDGHVASLFPPHWRAEENAAVLAIRGAPKLPSERVSFSMSKINSSARVWLLAAGKAKESIIERVIANDSALPATFARGRSETRLFTDQLME